MRRRFALPLVALLALSLAACGNEQPTAAPSPTATASVHDHNDGTHDHGEGVYADSGVLLAADGIGEVRFGDDVNESLKTLEAALGRPDAVTNWLPMQRSLWGACPGKSVKGAGWGDLWVLFSDSSELSDDAHVFGFILDRPGHLGASGLRTAEGIGTGSTLAALRAAYGEALNVYEGPRNRPAFVINAAVDTEQTVAALRGTLSGEDDDATVRTLSGGLACRKP